MPSKILRALEICRELKLVNGQFARDVFPEIDEAIKEYNMQLQHVGWAREWEGDDSDLGKYVVELCLPDEPAPDDGNWFPLYTIGT